MTLILLSMPMSMFETKKKTAGACVTGRGGGHGLVAAKQRVRCLVPVILVVVIIIMVSSFLPSPTNLYCRAPSGKAAVHAPRTSYRRAWQQASIMPLVCHRCRWFWPPPWLL